MWDEWDRGSTSPRGMAEAVPPSDLHLDAEFEKLEMREKTLGAFMGGAK